MSKPMTALERAKKEVEWVKLVCPSRNYWTASQCALADLVAEIEAAPGGKVSGILPRERACEVICDSAETPVIGKRVKILEVR